VSCSDEFSTGPFIYYVFDKFEMRKKNRSSETSELNPQLFTVMIHDLFHGMVMLPEKGNGI